MYIFSWAVIPVLVCEDGLVVQDTSDIIDFLEIKHPETSVLPPIHNVKQRLVSYICEVWADTWMCKHLGLKKQI